MQSIMNRLTGLLWSQITIKLVIAYKYDDYWLMYWSLVGYHQMNGIALGPSGPISYNTNAHLFNLFSPNSLSSLSSLSPMSPNPDLHSPSFYPRVSSLPSPYASSNVSFDYSLDNYFCIISWLPLCLIHYNLLNW